MKIKNISLIVMMTVWCSGVVNAQNAAIALVSTKAGNYEATNVIVSTQVLSKGTTTYVAGNQIVLRSGFQVKAGSEFVGTIDNPSNYLTIMTYNVENNGVLSKSAEVIKASDVDIVAIQELATIEEIPTPLGEIKDWLTPKFIRNWEKKLEESTITINGLDILKEKTGFEGKMSVAFEFPGYIIGIPGANFKVGGALLWNKKKLGSLKSPIKTCVIRTPGDDAPYHTYLVAEFADVAIIATHLPLNTNENKNVLEAILNEKIITSGKNVIIAGDLNPRPDNRAEEGKDGKTTINSLENKGFKLLNNRDTYWDGNDNEYDYVEATRNSGGQPDLIFWKNQNQNYKVISRGIPECLWAEDRPNGYPGGQYANWRFKISDHLPYVVKIKLK